MYANIEALYEVTAKVAKKSVPGIYDGDSGIITIVDTSNKTIIEYEVGYLPEGVEEIVIDESDEARIENIPGYLGNIDVMVRGVASDLDREISIRLVAIFMWALKEMRNAA